MVYWWALLIIAFFSWKISLLAGLSVFLFCFFLVHLRNHNKVIVTVGETFKLHGVSFVSAIFKFAILYLLLQLWDSPNLEFEYDYERWMIFSAIGLFLLFIDIAAIKEPDNMHPVLWLSILSAGAIFLIFFSLRIPQQIPQSIMRLYKIGNVPTKSIIIKKSSCDIVEAYGLKYETLKHGGCKVDNVKILSRLGKEFYLENDTTQFTIPKSEVVSWSVEKKSKDEAKSKE